MTPGTRIAIVTLVAVCLAGAAGNAKNRHPAADGAASATLTATGYDAARNPAKDLQAAIEDATRTNRRILLEVGGDWCVYCGIMDATFQSHPALKKVLDERYVTLKVNFSKENPNEAFLSKFPQIIDYPHFFVLDSQGTLLRSQPTHPFEHGKTYNVGKLDSFLKKYSQPPRHLLNKIS